MYGGNLHDFAKWRELKLIQRCAGIGTHVSSTYYTKKYSCSLQIDHMESFTIRTNIDTHTDKCYIYSQTPTQRGTLCPGNSQ